MITRLDIGTVVERSFQYYREQFGLLIPAAVIVFLPVAIIAGALRGAAGVLGAVLASIIQVAGNAWYQATVVEAIRDIQDGRRDFKLGSLFQSASAVLVPVAVVGLLYGVGVGIGLILVIIPGLIALTIWALVVPVTVVERPGIAVAFGRSRALVRDNGWQVFGVLVIFFVIQALATGILLAILIGLGSFVGYAIAAVIASVFLAPLGAIAVSVMYFQLRAIKGEPPLRAGPTPGVVGPPPGAAPGSPASQPPPPTRRPDRPGGAARHLLVVPHQGVCCGRPRPFVTSGQWENSTRAAFSS